MNKRTLQGSLLALSLLVAACGNGLNDPSPVTGGSWKLQRIQSSKGTVSIATPDRYTIEFKDSLQMGIKADCNVCGGSYTLTGSSFEVKNLVCTLAYCGDTSNDTAFLGIVTGARTLGVSGSELRIEAASGLAVLSR